jgi:Holliday junction resolvase RusA-like endonuclease
MGFRIEYTGAIVGNNKRYAFRGKKVNSVEYQNFKHVVGWNCKAQNKGVAMILGKAAVCISYNSGHDIDGILKGILDAVQNIAYKNDAQIKKLTVEKNSDIPKGFIMWVSELPNEPST